MLDKFTSEALTALKNRVAAIQRAPWEQLAGQDLAAADRLGPDVVAMARAALDEFVRLASRPDDVLRAMPPHLFFLLANKAAPLASNVLSSIDNHRSVGNREQAINNAINYANDLALSLGPLLRADAQEATTQLHTLVLKEELQITSLGELLSVKQKEFEALRAEVESMRQTKSTELDALRKESDEILVRIRDASARETANRQAVNFEAAADAHRQSSTYWLGISLLLSSMIIVSAVLAMVYGQGPPLPQSGWMMAANLSHFAARFLAISVVSFLLVAAIRNYRAAKHNQVTNDHRAKALKTFHELRDAASGQVADAVLLHAAQAMFSTQSSGYIEGGSSIGTHITELARTVSGPPKTD